MEYSAETKATADSKTRVQKRLIAWLTGDLKTPVVIALQNYSIRLYII